MSFWNTVMDTSEDLPYGKRLIPILIDEIARDDPSRICFSSPHSTNIVDGFRDITFRTFANAINKTAHFIHREIGRSSMFETVLYMGYPDVRHFVVLVALMKTGHKVLFSSHRNSVAGHADLIKKTDCTILVHTSGFPVSGILEKCRMESLCMPEVDYLLDDTPCELYPYTRTWEEGRNHPCLVIHTSGSTRLPKPVVWTQAMLTLTDAHHLVSPLDGRPAVWGPLFDSVRRSFNALPLFHGTGIAIGITKPVFNNTVTVLGPPDSATADIFDQVLEHGNIDSANCFPATLEEISTRPDILQKLGRLKYIAYVGGHLSPKTGDIISKHIPLYTIITSSETGVLVQHCTDPEDWQYVCFNPVLNGIIMRPVADLYELVFEKNPDQGVFQGVFNILPGVREFSMSDLYTKHPTKPHHWKLEGRKEDIIFLSDGMNFNPITHENIITTHPAVQNCLVVGTGKRRPGAIIELRREYYTEEEEQKRHVLEAIWPVIDEANGSVDARGRLEKGLIIFAKKEKPFTIAGNGIVRRKTTVKLYEPEIEQMFASAPYGTA
ncbi:acetyl-CoA synthetase-like protein [Lojkania enalia]|uniref:Acetyl-CoA synthetase-like protein n=1 Tax=Lojkania enalia TaxID=147567 RepID=A0A9P4KF59_9PLEO|nr:acetyl-CoA synthetase-like protein [Didymosphaeria enalia]